MIIETSDKRAFDRRTHLVQREPAEALKRGLDHPSRAGCTVRLFATRSRASLVGGHLAAAKRICRFVHEDDKITFTDTPKKEADAVVEPHSILIRNFTSAVATALADADRTNRPDALAPSVTRIVYPTSESTISMGPGDFLIESEVSPSLVSLEQLILLLDGEAVGTPQSSPKSQLTNVFRGAHRLQVVRVSETGETESQSTEHAVYIIRPTVNR